MNWSEIYLRREKRRQKLIRLLFLSGRPIFPYWKKTVSM